MTPGSSALSAIEEVAAPPAGSASSRPGAHGAALGIVALIALAGLLLRLPSYGDSLFGDELSTYFIVAHHGPIGILTLLDGHSVDLTPPLFFLLTRAARVFGSSPEVLRLVSLSAGTAAIPLTYLVGVRTVRRSAALAAAALMALSPYLIFYSTEARAYALVMLLTLVSTYCLVVAVADGGGRWWSGYAVASCAAMYTHYTALFVLVAQIAWALLAHRRVWRSLLLANVAAALGFIPWLPALIDNTRSFGTRVFGLLEPLTARAVGTDLVHWSIGHPFLSLRTVPGAIAIVMILVGVSASVATALRRRSEGAPWVRSPSALPVLLAVATPLGLALYSIVATDTWDMRNLIASWPGLALTAGALLTRPAPQVRVFTLGLVIAGYAAGSVQLLSAANRRPDYGAAARFIVADGHPRDPVAIVPAPTPGPLAAMDAAFAHAGQAGRPLLRLGSPTLQAVLHAPPYAFLPATPTPVLVAQAAHAAPGSRLFVVAPGTAPLSALLHGQPIDTRAALGPVFGTGTTGRLLATVYGPLSAFLSASASTFRPIETRTFPGVLRVSVYVLQRR